MDAIHHFKQGRVELVRRLQAMDEERQVLIGQIERVDELIKFLGAAGDLVEVVGFDPPKPPTMKEGLRLLGEQVDEFSFNEASKHLRGLGIKFTDGSLSSIISRTEGIERVRKGVYRLQKSEAPTELVEASVNNHWSSAGTDVPDQEGATDDHHRDTHPAPVTGAD